MGLHQWPSSPTNENTSSVNIENIMNKYSDIYEDKANPDSIYHFKKLFRKYESRIIKWLRDVQDVGAIANA